MAASALDIKLYEERTMSVVFSLVICRDKIHASHMVRAQLNNY